MQQQTCQDMSRDLQEIQRNREKFRYYFFVRAMKARYIGRRINANHPTAIGTFTLSSLLADGGRRENISREVLIQFQRRYIDDDITTWNIFHYLASNHQGVGILVFVA
jgi:hypothetical protein